MSNSGDILAITNAIQYFQNQTITETQPKQLQEHLQTFQTIFAKEEKKNKLPPAFLISVLTLFAQRYYELSASKERMVKQQYLQVKLLNLLHVIYKQTRLKGETVKKDLMVIMMWAIISQSKVVFQEVNEKCIDLRSALLDFNYCLLCDLAKREDFKIEQIYPKEYSLCSSLLKLEQLNLKQFGLCFQILSILINTNDKLRNNKGKSAFEAQCIQRLLSDVNFLISRISTYELSFKNKIQPFNHSLLTIFQKQSNKIQFNQLYQKESEYEQNKKQLFSRIILLAQLNNMTISLDKFNLVQKNIIKESYHFLYIQSCRRVMKVDVDVQFKKREIGKLIYLNEFVSMQNSQDSEIAKITIQIITHIFTIRKNHSLITIPFHATTIPLDKIQPFHNLANYPITGLKEEYQKQFSRMLVQIMPFFQLEPTLVILLLKFFTKIQNSNRQFLLRYFSDELLKYEYSVNMPLLQLYKHVQLLTILKFILESIDQISALVPINTIFYTLSSRSEAVKSLQASYVEQQLLIASTLQITSKWFYLLQKDNLASGDLRSKIKQTQISVMLLQTILNQCSESSYIIRLICIIALLDFTEDQIVEKRVHPYQATIVSRNKNNLQLILNLLQISSMNQVDYEELADYYLNHRGSESILRFLLPKISIQMGRKCILTVERWWLLLTRKVIEWLNCKQMKKSESQSQNFATNDGENVSIKNALGVIIIELGEKWIFYLRSQKRQTVVDILINLCEVNSAMVFFKSGFSPILKELHTILLECWGREQIKESTFKNKSSKHQAQTKLSFVQPTKIQYYNRLRHKICNFLLMLPSEHFILFSKQIVSSLADLFARTFESVKKTYLFQGNIDAKIDYETLKLLASKLQIQ